MEDSHDLCSVNWEKGMLITEGHFINFEKYIDALTAWLMRYCLQLSGLVGGGPRIALTEFGAEKHDPIVEIDEDDAELRLSISQCRGVSPAGDFIQIEPKHAIHLSVPKTQLHGVDELSVYATLRPDEKVIDDEADDPANPQMRSHRRRAYEIKLAVSAAEALRSLLLARLARKSEMQKFERLANFIPPCATLSAHSELTAAWKHIVDRVTTLSDRYTDLHRAIVSYVELAGRRGLNTRQDVETLGFVGRMIATLEDCACEALDSVQPPARFFRQMDRLVRTSAIYLDLSPSTIAYFQMLRDAGETEFASLLNQTRTMSAPARQGTMHFDLGQQVQRALEALRRLERLEHALDGKYVDYRVSASLENLNFVFDRNGEAFYQSVSKPSHPQVFDQDLTFVFAGLQLEGRKTYRLILMGAPQTRFELGETVNVEILINTSSGRESAPVRARVGCDLLNQRNFAVDFSTPEDVLSISDLRVTVRAPRQIRSGMLYARRRIYDNAPPAEPVHVAGAWPADIAPAVPALASAMPNPKPPKKKTYIVD